MSIKDCDCVNGTLLKQTTEVWKAKITHFHAADWQARKEVVKSRVLWHDCQQYSVICHSMPSSNWLSGFLIEDILNPRTTVRFVGHFN